EDSCFVGLGTELVVQKVLAGAFEPRPDYTYENDLVRDFSIARDPFTVTYRIRPEARWSDGVPVTAHDFVFTYQTVVKDEPPDSDLRRIRRIWAVDRKTVRVIFRAPTAGWQGLFDPVLPRHALAGEDFSRVWRHTIDNPKTGRPIGSGPFVVQRWDRGKELVLVRNRNWWGPRRPYLDRLVYRWRRDPVPATKSGDVDVINVSGRIGDVPELRRDPDLRILDDDLTGAWEHLAFNVRQSWPLADKRVRRALAYGIDRTAIMRDLFAGTGFVVPLLQSVVFLRQEPSYRENWSRYRHRPAEARRLLDEAGCRPGADGVRICDGRRLSLDFVTSVGNLRRERVARLVQEQLRPLGIEVVPQFATQRVFLGVGGLLPRGEFDIALFAWVRGSVVNDATSFLCGGSGNFGGYCSRLVNRELQQLPLALDPTLRARIANAADEKLALDVPVLPLYQSPNPIVVRKNVRGVVVHGFSGRVSYKAEDWWLAPSQ
ncbi:MAG: peptide ABC transporter substrate-binding protein, partial [Gaiellaceae bacterium]